jgi:hypothetical protein
MTNDQFPMTNGLEERALMENRGAAIRSWSFAIGIWSFPEIIRERIRE